MLLGWPLTLMRSVTDKASPELAELTQRVYANNGLIESVLACKCVGGFTGIVPQPSYGAKPAVPLFTIKSKTDPLYHLQVRLRKQKELYMRLGEIAVRPGHPLFASDSDFAAVVLDDGDGRRARA